MPRVHDPRNVIPDDIRHGDVMVRIVKVIISGQDEDGTLRYRVYSCHWPFTDLVDDAAKMAHVPQGSRILGEEAVCANMFPILAQNGKPDNL